VILNHFIWFHRPMVCTELSGVSGKSINDCTYCLLSLTESKQSHDSLRHASQWAIGLTRSTFVTHVYTLVRYRYHILICMPLKPYLWIKKEIPLFFRQWFPTVDDQEETFRCHGGLLVFDKCTYMRHPIHFLQSNKIWQPCSFHYPLNIIILFQIVCIIVYIFCKK